MSTFAKKEQMKIHHLAIWTDDIEKMRHFYSTYFRCTSSDKYTNVNKKFCSYFLSFEDGECRLELMNSPDIVQEPLHRGFAKGLAHFDIEVGDEPAVDKLVERLRNDGYAIVGEPRRTGDGYYEAAVLDPDGNYVELSAKQ